MSYLSLLIALFMTNGSGATGAAWWDQYLDNLVAVETWFYHASWWIWGILIVLAVIGTIIAWSLYGREALSGCGCMLAIGAVFLLTYPLGEWITMKLAMGMAEAVTAQGVVNEGALVMNALLYLLLGTS